MNKNICFFLLSGLFFFNAVYAADLTQVLQDAIENNPSLKQEVTKINTAHDQLNMAESALLPQLTLNTSLGRVKRGEFHQEKDQQRVQNTSLNLSQSLFDLSKWYAISIQKKNEKLQSVSYSIALQKLVVNVVTEYLTVISAADGINTINEEKKAIVERLEMIKKSYEGGLSSRVDLQNTQAKYDMLLAQEVNAKNKLMSSMDKLSELTGKHYNEFATLNTVAFQTLLPSNIKQYKKQIDKNNLAIKQAIANEELTKEKISYARADYLPTVSLSMTKSISQTHRYHSYYSDNNTDQSSAYITLSMPLFNGGSTYYKVSQAEQDYISAVESKKQVDWNTETTFHSTFNSLKADIAAVQAYSQAKSSADAALKAVSLGYQAGTRTIVDVLDATSAFYNTKSQLNMARYSWLMDNINFLALNGTISISDVKKISQVLNHTTYINNNLN